MLTHWGALEDQSVSRPMPVYRPPSARYRRAPIAQQPRIGTIPGPIVIEDEDDDEGTSSQPVTWRRITSLPREQPPGADEAASRLGNAPLISR